MAWQRPLMSMGRLVCCIILFPTTSRLKSGLRQRARLLPVTSWLVRICWSCQFEERRRPAVLVPLHGARGSVLVILQTHFTAHAHGSNWQILLQKSFSSLLQIRRTATHRIPVLISLLGGIAFLRASAQEIPF